MLFMDGFFTRISTDFRQRQLLPLKLLFFVHSSTIYVLYPYLTIHMRELGISIEETAIMSAVTPIATIFMPPIAGIMADRIGNFKMILSVFSALGGGASLLLLMVPVGRVVISYPQRTLLQVNTNGSYVSLNIAEPYPCQLQPNISLEREVQIEACGLLCNRPPSNFVPYRKGPKTRNEEEAAVLRARSYTVHLSDGKAYLYTLTARDLPLYREKWRKQEDVREYRILQNPGHYPTSVRRLGPHSYFFPTSGLYQLECEGGSCRTARGEAPPSQVSPRPQVLRAGLGLAPDEHLILATLRANLSDKHMLNVTGVVHLEEGVRVVVPLPNPENALETEATLSLEECSPVCLATQPRRTLCLAQSALSEFDTSHTFWMYLVIRVLISMISGTAVAMFEGAVIAILREHKADYGLQKIYATIGGMVSSPLSGYLIDFASENKQYTDFTPAFYLYAGLKFVSSLLMLTISLEFKAPATNVLADVMIVLRKIEIIALLITCFILGTAWGYIESFLFWLLQDLGASRSLMGITITIGGIAGLPLLVMSGPIIHKIGHANVLFIGFVFYAIRLLGYSLIYNPWMCLIFEAMESVTSSLAFTAAVTYAAKLSTTSTDSSIQGLLGGLYFGVGKGTGSLIGGFLMEAVGTRPTYQIFSLVTLMTGCIYFIFNRFYIVHRVQKEAKSKMWELEKGGEKKEDEKGNLNKSKDGEKIPMEPTITVANSYQGANGAFSNKGFTLQES